MGRKRCARAILENEFDVSSVEAGEDILFVGTLYLSNKDTGHIVGCGL